MEITENEGGLQKGDKTWIRCTVDTHIAESLAISLNAQLCKWITLPCPTFDGIAPENRFSPPVVLKEQGRAR